MKERAKRENKIYVDGIIQTTGNGLGFVAAPGVEGDIKIEPENLNTALNGDHVRVEIYRKREDRPTGAVVEILTRTKENFVGTIQKEGGLYLLKPQDSRMYIDIIIPKEKLHGAQKGEKVFVRIDMWKDAEKNPTGEVVEVLGRAGIHETEMKAIILDRGFATHFPQEIEREAEEIKRRFGAIENEISKRRDFRKIPTFTIDPEDAKDFDDALSIQKLPNGNFEVGIHIADVTFFVKEHSAIDKEAARRGTSIYLVDRTIPMLPEVLSNDLCSLNPNEDKLTFSAVLELTPQAKIEKRWFGKTIIRSAKRFTYKKAQEVLDAQQGIFAQELKDLYALSLKLRAKRFAAGAITFEETEVQFVLDTMGRPIKILRKERLETMKLIEDFMILANNEVALFATARDKNVEKSFVYRVHDLPDEDKMRELLNLLKTLDYDVPQEYTSSTPGALNKLLSRIEDEAHRNLIQMSLVQAMSKAIYTTKESGHFGLSLKHYTHFTSPIRRYPDIMVHRLLYRHLKNIPISEKEWSEYESLSRYATQMEIASNKAEWDSIKYKQTEYMSDHIGETFAGTITGVTEYGFFVRDDETLSEGMIRLRNLKDDYYVLNKKAFSVIGKRTKRKYTLGDKVRIKVVRTDKEKRLIDYKLV